MSKIYLLTHPLLILFIIFNICNVDGIFEPGGDKTLVPGDTVNVDYGKTLHNFTKQIWITFDTLYEDSRCEVDVICFWAGNARLGFVFQSRNRTARLSLNTYSGFSHDTTVYHYHISLVDVLPYRHSDSTYTAGDYTAQVVVDRE